MFITDTPDRPDIWAESSTVPLRMLAPDGENEEIVIAVPMKQKLTLPEEVAFPVMVGSCTDAEKRSAARGMARAIIMAAYSALLWASFLLFPALFMVFQQLVPYALPYGLIEIREQS
jgi:mannose/fructose/N-acetylgalactosamine-specific phosphotransferase system component IIC